MTLGIQLTGIRLVDGPRHVAIHVSDIVVQRVSHLAPGDVPREIPDQPVVNRMGLNTRQLRVVPPSQQHQFFLEQRRRLVHETMQRRGLRPIHPMVRPKRNRRIHRIRIRLVPDQHVQIRQPPRREQERVIRRRIIHRRGTFDAQAHAPAQHGLVDFDQPGFVHRLEIQRHIPHRSRPRLRDHAHDGVHLRVLVILDPLLERPDPRQHPLDPTLGQHRRRPIAPLGPASHRAAHPPITAHKVIVTQRIQSRAGNRDVHRAHTRRRTRLERPPLRRRQRRRQPVHRRQRAPLEFEVIRASGEIPAMPQRKLFGQGIR